MGFLLDLHLTHPIIWLLDFVSFPLCFLSFEMGAGLVTAVEGRPLGLPTYPHSAILVHSFIFIGLSMGVANLLLLKYRKIIKTNQSIFSLFLGKLGIGFGLVSAC